MSQAEKRKVEKQKCKSRNSYKTPKGKSKTKFLKKTGKAKP